MATRHSLSAVEHLKVWDGFSLQHLRRLEHVWWWLHMGKTYSEAGIATAEKTSSSHGVGIQLCRGSLSLREAGHPFDPSRLSWFLHAFCFPGGCEIWVLRSWDIISSLMSKEIERKAGEKLEFKIWFLGNYIWSLEMQGIIQLNPPWWGVRSVGRNN